MNAPADEGNEQSPSKVEGRPRSKLRTGSVGGAMLVGLGLLAYLTSGPSPSQQTTTTTSPAPTSTTAPGSSDPTSLAPMWRAVEHLEIAYGDQIDRPDLAAAALSSLAQASEVNPESRDQDEPVPDDVPADFEEVWQLWRQIESEGPEIEPRDLMVYAIEGMVNRTGDPEAAVLVDVAVAPDGHVEDTFFGIGAFVVPREGFVVISQPFPGGPASKAGIRPGDILIAVDGVPVAGMDLNEVVDRVRGPAGTTVSLVLQRAGTDPVEVEVTRETLMLGTARFSMHPGGIGYLAITSLEARTPAEVKDHLGSLTRRDTRALILDLRGNPGGSPGAALTIADEFLDASLVYLEEGLDSTTTPHDAGTGGLAVGIPLAILIDNATAGEAELLAAALRYHERGLLVGLPSGGEATLHRGHELGDGVVIVARSGRWLMPDGNSVEQGGLPPDHEVGLTSEDIAVGFDRPQAVANAYLWTLVESASQEDG